MFQEKLCIAVIAVMGTSFVAERGLCVAALAGCVVLMMWLLSVAGRVMATLGELLFYIATQQQESSAVSVQDTCDAWGVSAATVAAVINLLKPGEDDVCQHYAAKTIENICSQGGNWASKFAVQVTFSTADLHASWCVAAQ
jgi:hypothetical protein